MFENVPPVLPLSARQSWNRFIGRARVSGKELYNRMVENADVMVLAMHEGRRVDVLEDAAWYTGAEPRRELPPAVF